MATRRTTKTPDQRKAEVDALRAKQETAILDLIDSGQWTRYLTAMQHFRTYSLHNTLLILHQLPEATHVAGFNTWKKLGRKITSGPGSSLKIWGKPFRPKVWTPKGTQGDRHVYEEKDGQVKVDATFTRCPIVSVFDISQTDGDPIPEIATLLTDGDDTTKHQQVIDTLTHWLNTQGWAITTEPMASARGYTSHTTQTIALNDTNTTAQNLKTLIHEAAHAVLHGDDTYAPMSHYGTDHAHRGTAEVQAESVAYVVAGILGLDTSNYSTGYVTGWAHAAAGEAATREKLIEVLQQSATAVKKGVDTIMDGLDISAVITEAETALADQTLPRVA